TVLGPWLWRSQNVRRNFSGRLQWVHGSRTVVMLAEASRRLVDDAGASMGPRFSDRGYVEGPSRKRGSLELQLVPGSVTVVMRESLFDELPSISASMGPRFSDRGYA